MKISNLPDHTKVELHNYMKKNIRKYYKGLKSGSLKYNFFIETLLTKDPKPQWLVENPNLEKDIDFQKSLIRYVNNSISRYTQLEKENQYNNTNNNRILSEDKQAQNHNNMATTIKERHELKNILRSKGYTLSIPIKFLTSTESHCLKEYILKGTPIPLGWEKVLNYIKKSN